MKVIRYTDASFAARLREAAAASSLFDPVIEQRTRAILEAVQVRGDAALLEFTENFDGAKIAAERLAVTQAELFNASLAADESLRAAVAGAEKNIASFAKNHCAKAGRQKIRTAQASAKNSIRSSASVFIFPAEPRRSFRRH